MHDPLNLTLLLQMPNRHPCQATIDLQPLDQDTLTDEFEGGDFFEDTIVGGLVKGDGVLCLVLDFSF